MDFITEDSVVVVNFIPTLRGLLKCLIYSLATYNVSIRHNMYMNFLNSSTAIVTWIKKAQVFLCTPKSKIGGGILFCLSFCNSSCLKLYILGDKFWTVNDRGLTLKVGLLFENFNLVNTFSTMSARALLFHMSIPFTWVFHVIRSFCWYSTFWDPDIWPIFLVKIDIASGKNCMDLRC